MFSLNGKKAFVTGASGGIGEAIARILHKQGAVVGIHGTRPEKLKILAQDLGERIHIFVADLADRSQIDGLMEKVDDKMKGLDILVNNAGITKDGLFVRMSNDNWDKVLQVNLTACFQLCRDAVYPMMRRKSGRIINITSVVGVVGNPGQGNYCASKAGMIGMSKSLAQEVASRGITVNCIAPGFIKSPMTDLLNDKQHKVILSAVPCKRLGTGDEVAASVAFLASNEAAYITGQTIHVNGGMAMI